MKDYKRHQDYENRWLIKKWVILYALVQYFCVILHGSERKGHCLLLIVASQDDRKRLSRPSEVK